ncbi:MAG: Transketolase, central region [Candidatus Woesebacteria bacterium GW2011_GWA1_33_30]|uniref:Transketolase, central region n=1 Tax=Candidatus Woesebacteria bacterium GW2011_GWA2_33_28 TaxID=1618561 RepID=A0A0F9ZSN1_9BACT|nr:MAG: Transketolase, central region [Candidatus Woesebacteria bacterium GW2011_GWA2_33_28]KKP48170.1 MAG: Transketolase, central region [Candidatus Woesebacteria bacterium GW2011_GWA1_33_30]KKP49412.1 MAG: Transketolase, central region [Microgenomates group bacterium GW2011_GWC1_33_32]KKP52138.1 MAG: Transketolase, central region [Candidatus Woesebacteria bacterium GW2011_GWB1_33_38]
MLNSKLFLSDKIFKKDIEVKLMRDGFGLGLLEAGEKDPRIVVLSADLKESTKASYFAEKFPERFIEVGVAEQALVTIASGMANYGKIPFCTSYAIFSPGRNWEQIRTTIGIDSYPVKIIGAQSGLNIGHYGVTHQGLEDIALMTVIPNMNVVVPSDYLEAKKAILLMAEDNKPYYMRLPRIESPVYTTEKTPFKFGKANVLTESKNPEVTIVATGLMVYEALLAYKELEKNGIETIVVNMHTIKQIDEETIIRQAKLTGAVVTVEEHQVIGGLGSIVSSVLSNNFPVPMEILGVQDRFGQSGKPKELFEEYGLTKEDIIKAVKKVIARKNS